MTLSIATLANQLDTQVSNSTTEPPARTAWALAWTNYFYDATANGIPIPPNALNAAKAALESGLVGFSIPSNGALRIQTGLTSFWAILAGTPAAIFGGSIAITPPAGLAGIAAALTGVFITNTAPGINKNQALTNIATVLHTSAGIGGTATFPPAVIFPIL